MFSERINKWFSHYKRYLFHYKDGFFELPYLSNSPQAIIGSIVKMPFVKHSKKKQIFSSDTLFVNAVVHYAEIEQGLWIMYSDAFHKVNVNFRRIVNKHLPYDYYLLALEVAESEIKPILSLANGISYANCSWLLFKPGASASHCRFKGSRVLSFSVFFHVDWLKNVLCKQESYRKSNIKHFFESKSKIFIWPENTGLASAIIKTAQNIFNNNKMEGIYSEALKKQTHNFIEIFLMKYNNEELNKNFFEISDVNRIKILKAERILSKNIGGSFIGIEELAKQAEIAPTRLKSNFKLVFGQPVFQYFRKKQMEYARSLLQQNTICIKDIANMLGYENPSKFSATFKELIGVLPSEI